MHSNPSLVRVFRIPPPTGQFCFGDGQPAEFIEIDWFTDEAWLMSTEPGRERIAEFIRSKRYYSPDEPCLVLSPIASFTMNYTASR